MFGNFRTFSLKPQFFMPISNQVVMATELKVCAFGLVRGGLRENEHAYYENEFIF